MKPFTIWRLHFRDVLYSGLHRPCTSLLVEQLTTPSCSGNSEQLNCVDPLSGAEFQVQVCSNQLKSPNWGLHLGKNISDLIITTGKDTL